MRPRPQITLAWAQSLDGSLSRTRGTPTRLSGPASQVMTHRLRAQHDAILVGIGTVLADDPALTVRVAAGPQPQPIIVDSRLRTPATCQLARRRAWIATTTAHTPPALIAVGVTPLRCAADAQGRVDLHDLLAQLASRGVRTLMVEGGGEILAAFLAAGVVDRVSITIAPVWLNGYRPTLPLPPLPHAAIRRLDADILLEATL